MDKLNPLHTEKPRTDFAQSDLLADCKDQMSAAQLVAHHRAGELIDQQTCEPVDPCFGQENRK